MCLRLLMRRLIPWPSLAGLLVWASACAVEAPAVQWPSGEPAAAVRIESIRVGFGGVYRVGHWAPTWVTLANDGPDVDVELQIAARDGEGVQAQLGRTPAARVRLIAGGKTAALQYFKAGRAGSGLTVRVVGDQGELAKRSFSSSELGRAEPSTQELIVSLGSAAGIEDAARKTRRDGSQPMTVCTVSDQGELPTEWYGYEAVNTLFATTGDAGVLEKLTDDRFEALDRWLKLGGRMVLCAGRRGAEVFAPGNRLARFSPGSRAEVVTQRVTSGLENYARSSERLDAVGGQRARRFGVSMTALADVQGLVESAEVGGPAGRLPTIVRYPYGLGQLVFLAFDPELPPFDKWQGRPALLARALQVAGTGRQAEEETDTRLSQVAHLGYEDLVGQLRSALEQFPGVTRVQFSWVAGLIAVYLLLIGPADYFLLKRFNGLTWTWLTFPLVAIVFCGLAYGLVQRLSGRQVHVNQVDVVDVALDQGVVRGSAWVHLYSPATREFTLDWEGSWPLPQAGGEWGRLLAWQGLPGRGLGGLDGTGGAVLFDGPYTVTACAGRSAAGPSGSVSVRPTAAAPPTELVAAVSGLPVEVSGTKSLAGVWWQIGELQQQRLSADINGLLSGRLTNPLPVDLTDCMVVYENWIYPVAGALRPGEGVSFDGVSPRNLEWHLSRRRVVDTKDVGTPWDQSSVDVPRILELMMFYGAAGGAAYTGLTHRYQPGIDLSGHLRTGRAVLVGRSAAAGSRLGPSGEPWDEANVRRWTFYRAVVPVDRSERAAVP
ncbi:MAG: hypothetical protein GX575_19300 [Candidatus Anammoximicrobium sp.]|nr:hypothetical protein [Candidatus Anammoximicrobium sp.]